jgi:hypothetical protein
MADALQFQRVLTVSKTASTALAAYRLVTFSGENAGYTSAQYGYADGVTLHACASGDTVEIGVIGVFPVQVKGAQTNMVAGDGLCPYDGTTGYAQKAAGAASRPLVATALATSTTDGDIINARFPATPLSTA